MPRAQVGRQSIAYSTTGDQRAPALVLIMGTAAPLTMWDDEFCEGLADRGFRVVRFDYRDTGRSTYTQGPMPSSIPEMMAAFAEGKLKPSYRLEDSRQRMWSVSSTCLASRRRTSWGSPKVAVSLSLLPCGPRHGLAP